MHGIDAGLLIVVLTLGAALFARRFRTPMPVMLAAIGIAAGVAWRSIPWLPRVFIPPDLVLFAFLPPLLSTAAYAVPFGLFRRNFRSILELAVGLVLWTMIAAALVAHAVAGLPWAAAFALGAIVAPPDPVAAATVTGETGLSHRLVAILEGEGLVNDAIAIVAYGVAVEAAVTGKFNWGQAILDVVRQTPFGILIGLFFGWIIYQLRRRLDDPTLEAGISILAPYLTYRVADVAGGSGVLAVVTLGFVFRGYALRIAEPATRLAARTVWGAIRFASTALVFFLLGFFIGEIAGGGIPESVAIAGLAVAAVVIAIRLGWMFTVPQILRRIGFRQRAALPPQRELFVFGWAGMRGVVSLALALAFPSLPGAQGGDVRAAVILMTFTVIVCTLVLQGFTLLPVVHLLHVGDPEREARDEQRARTRARWAGLAALERAGRADPTIAPACEELGSRIGNGALGLAAKPSNEATARALSAALLAQRLSVDELRDRGRLGETLGEALVTEVDVDLMRVRGESRRITGEA